MRKKWYQWHFSLWHLVALVFLIQCAVVFVFFSNAPLASKLGEGCLLLIGFVLVFISTWRKLRREVHGPFRFKSIREAHGNKG